MTPFSVILSAVAAVKLYFGRCFNIQDLTDLEDFSQDTFNRLAEIYSTVFLVSTFMTMGQFLQIEDELGGSSTLLALAGSLYALLVVPEHNEVIRIFYVNAAALLMGASWFPYTQSYHNIDPGFINVVFLGITFCLGVFRTVPLWIQTRVVMYCYGMLYSTILSMVWAGFILYHFNWYLVLVAFLYLLLLSAWIVNCK